MSRADIILNRAEAESLKSGDSKYAAEAGILRAEVRHLCDQLDGYENPPIRGERFDVFLDGKLPLVVGACFDQDERNEPVYVDYIEVWLGGFEVSQWFEADMDAIRSDVLEQRQQQVKREAEDAAIERYQDAA